MGLFGSAIPTSNTLIGASDGTNLQQLLVESASNRNLRIGIYNGSNEVTVTGANALKVDGSAVTQNITGTGSAGSASSGVLSVQGIASMTPLKIDGTATTQPVSGSVSATVSGSVTANIGTTNGLALDASISGILLSQASTTSGQKGSLIQGAVTTSSPTYVTAQTNPLSLTTAGALRVDSSTTTQPISGTVTANVGTTNGLALDSSVNGTLLSQGSATSSQKGTLIQGAVTTGPPSYITTQTSPISLTTSGSLRVDATGTVTANAGIGRFTVIQGIGTSLHAVLDTTSTTAVAHATASNLNAQIQGAVASRASNTGNPVKKGGVFNTTQPTVTNGQVVDAQFTARGASIVATGVDAFAVNASQTGTWNITNVSGTITLPTGASTAAKQPALGTAGTASADVLTVQGIASMTALKVDGSAVTQPVSGTITANAGTGSFAVTQATASSLNTTSTIQAVTGTSLAAD